MSWAMSFVAACPDSSGLIESMSRNTPIRKTPCVVHGFAMLTAARAGTGGGSAAVGMKASTYGFAP